MIALATPTADMSTTAWGMSRTSCAPTQASSPNRHMPTQSTRFLPKRSVNRPAGTAKTAAPRMAGSTGRKETFSSTRRTSTPKRVTKGVIPPLPSQKKNRALDTGGYRC